jgi:hypothetical protein
MTLNMVDEPNTYEEFWPYYVAMHSRAATRWLHMVGTLSGLALAADGLLRRRSPKALGWLPALGYGLAWPSHFLIEGNNPASFGHPLWSLRGDVQMIGMMLQGRDAELARTAEDWLAAHPEYTRRPWGDEIGGEDSGGAAQR